MSRANQLRPATLGLFEQRFAGDESLIWLAQRWFSEARMGLEIHAGTIEQLEWFAAKRWKDARMVLHLPREFDLLQEDIRSRTVELATRCHDSMIGLVIHDHPALTKRRDDYLDAVRKLNQDLERSHGALVFIEYAVGLEPDDFLKFFESIRDLDRLSACIDIGHVGIRATRAAFAKARGGQDVCALKSQGPELPRLMPEVDDAVAAGFAAVLRLIEQVTALNKPVHFHLHDGHPLSTVSPFGVADHLSFFSEIPLNFEYRGRRTVPTMFGPSGLGKVIGSALKSIKADKLSFTLEIHPTDESLPLDETAALFQHWTIKTNAERTNHWLSVLAQNHSLLQQAIETALVR